MRPGRHVRNSLTGSKRFGERRPPKSGPQLFGTSLRSKALRPRVFSRRGRQEFRDAATLLVTAAKVQAADRHTIGTRQGSHADTATTRENCAGEQTNNYSNNRRRTFALHVVRQVDNSYLIGGSFRLVGGSLGRIGSRLGLMRGSPSCTFCGHRAAAIAAVRAVRPLASASTPPGLPLRTSTAHCAGSAVRGLTTPRSWGGALQIEFPPSASVSTWSGCDRPLPRRAQRRGLLRGRSRTAAPPQGRPARRGRGPLLLATAVTVAALGLHLFVLHLRLNFR